MSDEIDEFERFQKLYSTGKSNPAEEVSVVAPRNHGKNRKPALAKIDALYSKKSAESAIEGLTGDIRDRLNNVMTDEDIDEILELLDQVEKLVENEMEMSSDGDSGLDTQAFDGKSKSNFKGKYRSRSKRSFQYQTK